MADRTWNKQALEWGNNDPKSGDWVRDDPEQPEWSKDPAGLAARFVRIWQASASISDVRQTFFWVPVAELEVHHRSMNAFLVQQGYAPLTPLPLRVGEPLVEVAPILSAGELAALESEGVLRTLGSVEEAEAAAPEAPAQPAPTDAEEADGELDLTPAPPRPDEDPYRGVSPLSLAIPGYGNHDKVAEYYAEMGADKMRIRIKH